MTKARPPHSLNREPAHLAIQTIPLSMLDQPLNYIIADHVRQRAVCATLQRFAVDKFVTRNDADTVTAFLTQDRVVHEADEEDDLFPAVSRKAFPEDNLGAVLACLRDDHRRNRALVHDITTAICRHPARDVEKLSTADCELMQVFAKSECGHIAIENNVVLAIARIRLSPSDLKSISRGMKARRGVVSS